MAVVARRREVPEAEGEVPAVAAFRVADWCGLPAEPPDWFLTRYAGQGGTKGSLEEEWHLYRAVRARRLWSAARREARRKK